MFRRRVVESVLSVAVLTLPLACPVAAAPADDWSTGDFTVAAELRDRALRGTLAFEHASSLVTEVGPRLAGSRGDRASVAWALAYLRTLGFDRIEAQPVSVPRWERGTAVVEITAPWPQPLVAVALGGSVGTPDHGIEAPVLRVGNLAELEALGAERVAGHIVFIDEKMLPSRDASTYGVAVRKRTAGPSIAGSLGAAALVIRSVGTSQDRIAHTGALVYRIDAPRIPAVAISNPDADLLARQFESGEPVTIRLALTSRDLPPAMSANVIAEVVGSERPDEIVLLGAHLDSWDLAQGAEDDAAGVAIVAEAARLIEALPMRPSRTVQVVLFANEEFGLSGASEYARALEKSGRRVIAALEADLGSGAPWGFQGHVAAEAEPALRAMHQVLEPLGIEFVDTPAFGGADLQPLKRSGTPVLQVRHDATHYFDVHHTVNDTLERVDRAALDRHVAAYAAMAYLAATKRGDFGRLPPPTPPAATP
ncbi:MAG TPA: M20/M25/M40 family metallo-hydrolase [Steroidobacteraceae bacterium]|nr:M20/M25/M40 family metallo-hydrolase [Steroidobacteraceae bacterium]